MLEQHRQLRSVPEKIGLYTSPHLISVRERIQINSQPIAEQMFARYFFEVWDALEASAQQDGRDASVKPVYFRFLTLLSWHIFVSEAVDVAIYEVGVGGAWDSTNIVERPIATGITTLGIDHEAVLGDTLAKIAWHKAGIFKSKVPAFSVEQFPEGAEVLKERAQEIGTRVKFLEEPPFLSQKTRPEAQELLRVLQEALSDESPVAFAHVNFTTNVTRSKDGYRIGKLRRDPRCAEAHPSPEFENRNACARSIKELTVQKQFAEIWSAHDGIANVHLTPTIQGAIELAEALSEGCTSTEILVTGSLHLVGGVLALLEGASTPGAAK
ncbi:hypothetical protein PV08_08492 [Exophiala spinifera]|uniref:Folylpoly-gamma-glutamate synthetase n=1 Tax=Exophiala spinifera TaxID=91928 RepID=A0A0D2BQ96_9EURO|nr:uncharacterized protein PV08_08492 [Exophiala spinifera]KIW13304.1 hypothetical protein PV08_08492 [Exophiala spinifera]